MAQGPLVDVPEPRSGRRPAIDRALIGAVTPQLAKYSTIYLLVLIICSSNLLYVFFFIFVNLMHLLHVYCELDPKAGCRPMQVGGA